MELAVLVGVNRLRMALLMDKSNGYGNCTRSIVHEKARDFDRWQASRESRELMGSSLSAAARNNQLDFGFHWLSVSDSQLR